MDREKAVMQLRCELDRYQNIALEMNAGNYPDPDQLQTILEEMKQEEQ